MKQVFRRKKPPLVLMEKNFSKPSPFLDTVIIAESKPVVRKEFLPVKKSEEQLRAERGIIFRGGMMIHGTPCEKIDGKSSSFLLKCGKCNMILTDSEIEKHLILCQPLGAYCGKCGKRFSPNDFLNHFKDCKGLRIKLLEGK